MAKPRRGRVKGSKNKKAPEWAYTYGEISVRRDIGSYERWGQEIGLERIDEANAVRRDTMKMLSLRDRELDAGGRVVAKAAVAEFEHLGLDPLLKFGVLDDPKNPERAQWRHDAGIALFALWMAGHRSPRVTAPHGAVGGGGGRAISPAEAESREAHAESRYLRALDACGEYDDLMQTVCCQMVLPLGTKRRALLTGLDLLAEFLLGHDAPADIVRPRLKIRDTRRMG